MTTPFHPLRAVAASARYRVDRAEAIKREWQVGQRPDAAAALRENPDIAVDRPIALDLAYEEFCAREEAGEILDPVAFCAQFSFGASLHRLLAVHQFLDDHPDALDGVPASWPAVDETVGDFRVLRELGRGSFARVYLASETTAGDRPVVLKVSGAGSREADTLGPLAHPHLIPVLSSRAAGAWTVVAMPFSGTATLEDVLEVVWHPDQPAPRSATVLLDAAARGGLPDDPPFPSRPAFPLHARMAYEDAVVAVAVGVLGAVAYLHERGITHRDLKPSNVLFGPSGHPYLLDFNLASRAADPWRLVGTLPYMAPEQLALMAEPNKTLPPDGVPAPDGRPGDVFACGVILFELLTGRHPFRGPGAGRTDFGRDQVAATLLAAQRAGSPTVVVLNPRVRWAVCAAVERCLALDPRARPSAAELAELFSRTGSRPARWIPLSVLAGAGALVLGLSYTFSGPRVPQPDAPTALPSPEPAPHAPQPDAPTDPFELGSLLYKKGQPGLAAVEFLAAGKSGKEARIRGFVAGSGLLLGQPGQPEPAVVELLTAGKAGNEGRAYGYAAYCLAVAKDPGVAISAGDDAISLGYRTAPVYANRAFGRLQSGLLQKAIEDCDEALRLDPDLLPARFTRAGARLQMSFVGVPVPPETLVDIDRVTAGFPNSPDAWSTAAMLHALVPGDETGRRDKAARAIQQAVRAGKAPKAIEQNPLLMMALKGHPVFEEAMKSLPGSPAPSIDPRLVNPISEHVR